MKRQVLLLRWQRRRQENARAVKHEEQDCVEMTEVTVKR